MKIILIHLLLSPALLIAACNPHKLETRLGSHTVTVIPGCVKKTTSSRQDGAIMTYKLSCSDTFLVIKNEELMINDHSYGTLKDGDSITVDYGKVFVNGKEVTGTPVKQYDPSKG